MIIIICFLIEIKALDAADNLSNKSPSINLHNKTTSTLEKKSNTVTKDVESFLSDETGFLSKLNNLIFGPSVDAETAETQHSASSVQYSSPPAAKHAFQQDCNPCNKEPWIPIVTNYGHNKITGFMQSTHDVSSNGNGGLYNHDYPSGSYGTPNINHAPNSPVPQGLSPPSPHILENFKPPAQISSNYGLPNLLEPHNEYGPPEPSSVPIPQHTNYGLPPVPPQDNFDSVLPEKNFDISSGIQNNYGLPSLPPSNYGSHLPPSGNYGSPPAENYVPPPQPSESYRPSHSGPSDSYGAPINFDSPQPLHDYSTLVSAPSFSVPSLSYKPAPASSPVLPSSSSNFGNHYGPPKPIFKIPSKNYGPPINQPNFRLNKPVYPLGKAPRQLRPGLYPRPSSSQPIYKYIPLKQGKVINLLTDFKPPPPPPNYNTGPAFNSFSTLINHGALTQNTDLKPQVTNPEYLPPLQQLPIATGHNAEPIAFPNLSLKPVAPLHNPQNFHDNFPQSGSHIEIPYESNVQIQKSIPVADFVATIEHPISVIRSPILEVNVANTSSQSDHYYSTPSPQNDFNYNNKPTYGPTAETGNYDDYKLSENPIIVEDTHVAAATNENKIVSSFSNLHSGKMDNDFISQLLTDAGGIGGFYTPSPSTSMQPPPIGESPWIVSSNQNSGIFIEEPTSKRSKQIQIIIPYTTNTEYDKRKAPVELPAQAIDAFKETFTQETILPFKHSTSIVNIQDFFKNNKNHNVKNLPLDVIRLQNNIDGWTEQEYSKNLLGLGQTSPVTSSATYTTKFKSSKRIPEEYLTTLPFTYTETKHYTTTIPPSTLRYLDHEPAGSNSKEYLQSNLIATTEEPVTSKYQKLTKVQTWDKIHIAVSPLTKEKIYVVTPQPKTATPSSSSWRQSRDNDRNSSTFSISIIPMRNTTEDSNDIRVVLSEWPHLINNLATITKPPSTTTTIKPTSRHPLFGLMDLASYTPPSNSTIETYSGHSKVINVATASLKKRTTEEKKATTTMKSTVLK